MTNQTIPDEYYVDIEKTKYKLGYWKALYIGGDFKPLIRKYGLLNMIWGWDIFFYRIPFMKSLITVNILIWIIMYLALK